jgi:hypothetical protein
MLFMPAFDSAPLILMIIADMLPLILLLAIADIFDASFSLSLRH